MSFKLKVKKIGKVPVLCVRGEMTGNNIAKMIGKLESIRKVFSSSIGIDLSGLSFIDSHGLGALLFFYRRLHEDGRQLIIIKPSEMIAELLSGSMFDRVFTIVDSVEKL